MNQITLTRLVKEFAQENGAELVGIAPVERFEGAPAGHHPHDILPDAKSVVVGARPIPASVFESSATSYQMVMDVAHRHLDLLATQVALFLENKGGKAIPVPSDEPYLHWEAERCYGRGDLSHKHAAQAAGLGCLGKNSLLITSEFGNRVELVSVVTTVEMVPDDMLQRGLCPAGCSLCIKACPVDAIEDGQQVNQKLCRDFMIQRLPKGMLVENCRECRKVCRVGTQEGPR